jgi:hypothetical protein
MFAVGGSVRKKHFVGAVQQIISSTNLDSRIASNGTTDGDDAPHANVTEWKHRRSLSEI